MQKDGKKVKVWDIVAKIPVLHSSMFIQLYIGGGVLRQGKKVLELTNWQSSTFKQPLAEINLGGGNRRLECSRENSILNRNNFTT